MNLFSNKGVRWGLKIFLLHLLIMLVLFVIGRVFPGHLENSDVMEGIVLALLVPFVALYVVLCGAWGPGIFDKCTSSEMLDWGIAGVVVLLAYMLLGYLINGLVGKIRKKKVEQV
jgi:uncharacterized membrane protein YjfL (UPF0719 family)